MTGIRKEKEIDVKRIIDGMRIKTKQELEIERIKKAYNDCYPWTFMLPFAVMTVVLPIAITTIFWALNKIL